MAKIWPPIGQRKLRRLWIAALCIAGLLTGCAAVDTPGGVSGSSNAPTASASNTADTLTLAYNATDTLNPYTAKTKTNQELSRLLYDGLIALNQAMEPEYCLAQDIEIQGTKVTVTLREAYFSDGSRVTPEDVVASMEAARQAKALSYQQDFAVVDAQTVTANGKVVITLKHEDPYFLNFLDFPVYKTGSDAEQNGDNKDLPPIGSGRYIYHEEAGKYWLTANEKWYGGNITLTQISLLNLPDDDAIDHAVQVGTIDWYYSDLSDNAFPNMNGVSIMVPLQNLVFLGANMNTGLASLRPVRLGISAALNRTDITENAYFGVAKPAAGPYPEGLQVASGLQTIAAQKDEKQAKSFFTEAGFSKSNSDGILTNGSTSLTLRLIYNKGNDARQGMAQLITNQLAAVGCKVQTEALSFEQYQNAIKNGYYDLYIGEMRIPDNLDLYPLLTAGDLLSPDVSEGSPVSTPSVSSVPSASQPDASGADMGTVSTDTQDSLTAARAAYRYHTGKGSLTEMLSCFNEQLPIIPICHRTGMLIYASFISGQPTPIAGDPYRGIERCTIKF